MEQKHQNKLISALREIVLSGTSSFDLDTLAQRIVETCVNLSHASRGAIFLYNESCSELVMRAEKNHAPKLRFIAGYEVDVTKKNEEKIGLTVFAFIRNTTLALNSVEQIKSHPAHLGKYTNKKYGNTDCHSVLCIPLKTNNGEAIGILKLENTLDQKVHLKFSETTKKCLELIADVATEAIINFKGQVSKIEKSTDLILSNSLGSNSTGNLTERLRQISMSFKEISNAGGVSIWLIEGSKLVCKAAVGNNYQALEKKEYPLPPHVDGGISMGLTPWIAKTGETINIKTNEQIIAHPQYRGTYNNVLYPDGQDRCESFIGTPLKIGEKIIGVIKADNRVQDDNHPEEYFTTEESQIFSYLAVVTSIIVKSEQQFQTSSKHDKKLLDLYKLGTECCELDNHKDIFRYLLVGLTNGEGIGFNRVVLFKFSDDLDKPYLTGIMGIGPRDKAEAKRLQVLFDLGEKFDINFCKSHPEKSRLSSFIEEKRVYLSKKGGLYDCIIRIRNEECYPMQMIEVENCDKNVKNLLKTLGSNNNKVHIFSLSDADGQTYVGICDSMYANSNAIDEFCENAANTFINQVSIALSKLSLEKSKEEATEKAWREFTAITAHRIGTETAIISGALNYLKKTLKPLLKSRKRALWEEELEDLENSVENLKMAVREYTELQKAPIKKRQKIGLSELLDQVKHEIEKLQSTSSKEIKVSRNYPNNLPVIYGDWDCLTYAFKELLDNAVKALPQGGKINIYTNVIGDSDHIKIYISDNGPGIRPEVMSKIFDPGFKDRIGGTGLGLHIVKKNIELHQGKIEARNNPSGGASFLVTLRIQKFDQDDKKRVLLIEDNKVHRKQIMRSMRDKSPDFEVDIATNEADAITLIKQAGLLNNKKPYDFVVADVNLEDGGGSRFGGVNVLEFISKNNIESKVIIVTAHQTLPYRDKSGHEKSVLEKSKELNVFQFIPRNQPDKDYLDELNKVLYI